MSDVIKEGTGYKLTPAMDGQPKRLAYVSSRRGNLLTLMLINGIVSSTVVPASVYGREFAKVQTPFGSYNLSPCGEVTSLDDVAEVCDIIKQCPES